MKLYKRVFLFPQTAQDKNFLLFTILYSCYQMFYRNKKKSQLLSATHKNRFRKSFFLRILCFCSSTHEIEREWEYRGYFYFHFSLKRQALKQENNAELKCLFLQYKKNKSNQIHGFTTISVVTPQIKIKNLYLRDH